MIPSSLLLLAFFLAPIRVGCKYDEEDVAAENMRKATAWLMGQRGGDFGWGSGLDTAQAVLALETTKTTPPLERKLSAKQLEIQLILNLWQHVDEPEAAANFYVDDKLTAGNIAAYALALKAACYDPRFFHGHDLIGSILHHEPDSDYEFAASSLAACKSGAHVRKRNLRRLLEIANDGESSVETLSQAILALHCVERDYRNRNVRPLLKKPCSNLEKLQEEDGGFGSLHATAVAIQALQDTKAIWNETEAVNWLLNHQGPDGAFFDVPTTAEAIVALASVLNSGAKEDCELYSRKVSQEAVIITPHANLIASKRNNTVEFEESGEEGNITVTYSLWVGSNVTRAYSTNVTISSGNVSFYDVMTKAAEFDKKYEFSAMEWPSGHYVHTLGGFKEEPASYHYWLLYKLPDFPDPEYPPENQMVAPTGKET